MAEHYFTVGVHGAPTPETAPHGVMWRHDQGDGDYSRWYYGTPQQLNDGVQWAPLPAPPTEEAPPPEPVAPWSYGRDQVYSRRAVRYRDALNALDRDGVAWGPGRPMSELPKDRTRILVKRADGELFTVVGDLAWTSKSTPFVCWWPLPLPGEAQ